MTKEGFVKWLRPWVDDGIAFVAYWHPGGCGRLRTAPLPTEKRKYILHEPKKKDRTVAAAPRAGSAFYDKPGAWAEPIYVPGPPKELRKGALNRWRANVDKLRRSASGEVITVEFDGKYTSIQGGELQL